jgi:two-component system sensor histidine kinase UhpB
MLFPFIGYAQQCTITPEHIAAAKAGEDVNVRPQTGWETVSLPDVWSNRWPDYTGSVWYRIDLSEQCRHATDVAIFVSRINMTGAVWLNDSLLWQDSNLIEPLSRSWNMPRMWQIPAELLSRENNTIWVRVVGIDYHQPGLGKLVVGDRASIGQTYSLHMWMQRYTMMINLVISGVVGLICLLIWMMRRSERIYGWYGLASVLWVAFGYNTLALTVWPFSSSILASQVNGLLFMLFVLSFCIFTWRLGKINSGKFEKILTVVAILLTVGIAFTDRQTSVQMMGVSGGVWSLLFFANCIYFPFHAWRVRRVPDTLLAVCLLSYLGIGVYSALSVMQVIEAEFMYVQTSAITGMLFIALMLAWMMVSNIKKVETAAQDLKITVDETRAQLTSTLQREHTLEIQNIRLKERLQLARDLHDGFGSSLVRSITLVEQTSETLDKKHYLSILKSVRDDLRQVIDNTAIAPQPIHATPGQWIAPIRHRFMRIFEEIAIQSSWSVMPHWPLNWTQSQLIDLTRFVEEALTNVIKHSHASHVWVELTEAQEGDATTLSVHIRDDGTGFDHNDVNASCMGLGMHSMQARITKLGGILEIQSGQSGTSLQAYFKYQSQA